MIPALGIGSSLRWAPFHVSTLFVSTSLVSGTTCSPRRPDSLLMFRWYLNISMVFRNQIRGWVSSQRLGCHCFWALPAAGAGNVFVGSPDICLSVYTFSKPRVHVAATLIAFAGHGNHGLLWGVFSVCSTPVELQSGFFFLFYVTLMFFDTV